MHKDTIKHKNSNKGKVPIIFACLLLLVSGSLYYYNATIQTPLAKFFHPVSRSPHEPPMNTAASSNVIMGRSWNILLMGSDDDQKYTFPAVLTQVMILVHIDTIHNSINLVSIPRDSWIYVPEIAGMHKIDQAFFLGARQQASFDDGVRLARLTVEKDYGVSIDRYAWIGLSGFIKAIDTLGGVDIDVTHPVVDDSYPDDTGINPNDPYTFKRLYITPGPHHLDGVQALEYVRSRHADLIGDIGRTQRQQQILETLKQKLGVTGILSHLPALLQDLTGSVYTDLSTQEMVAFGNFSRTLSSNSIQHITLGPGSGDQNYGDLTSVYDPLEGDQDVLIPHCEYIQPVMNRIFGNVQSCNIMGVG